MQTPFKTALDSISEKPVYRDDRVALYHADCREVLKQIEPANDVAIVSDPPYGINWVHFHNPVPILGDDRPFSPEHLLRFRCILFGAMHYCQRLPTNGSWMIWDKRCPHCGGEKRACRVGPCHTNDLGDYEDIWANFRTHRTIFRHYWNGFGRASEQSIKRIHPTQKPVLLMGWLIERAVAVGGLVLDPYAGSCSTLVAAMLSGRYAIGIEADERHIGSAVERLQATRNSIKTNPVDNLHGDTVPLESTKGKT